MRKQAILVLAMVVLLAASASASTYSGGDGSAEEPYRIATPNDLNDIGNHEDDWDAHFVMVNDINLAGYTGAQFNIIGDSDNPFTGVFDGNGYTIKNFTYTTSSTNRTGIFALTVSSVIRDLELSNVEVNMPNGRLVAGLVARAEETTIQNCNITGFVVGNYAVGSLVGVMMGELMQDCHSQCNVSGNDNVGGLAGLTGGDVVILQCSSTSNTVTGGSGIGGIAGNNDGDIRKCYTTSSISGNGWALGGIAGYHSGGGLIQDCYSYVSIEGGERCGGIAGSMELADIEKCYSASYVSGLEYIGGILGIEDYGSNYSSCFWDSDVSPDVNGIGNGSDPNVIGLPTAEMMKEDTFTDAGWDFVEIWNIGEHQTYPYLRVYPAGDLNHDGRVDFFDFAIAASHWLEGAGQ